MLSGQIPSALYSAKRVLSFQPLSETQRHRDRMAAMFLEVEESETRSHLPYIKVCQCAAD